MQWSRRRLPPAGGKSGGSRHPGTCSRPHLDPGFKEKDDPAPRVSKTDLQAWSGGGGVLLSLNLEPRVGTQSSKYARKDIPRVQPYQSNRRGNASAWASLCSARRGGLPARLRDDVVRRRSPPSGEGQGFLRTVISDALNYACSLLVSLDRGVVFTSARAGRNTLASGWDAGQSKYRRYRENMIKCGWMMAGTARETGTIY